MIDAYKIELLHDSSSINCAVIAPQIFQLLGYRQHMANVALSCTDDDQRAILNENIAYTNSQLCTLLAIPDVSRLKENN